MIPRLIRILFGVPFGCVLVLLVAFCVGLIAAFEWVVGGGSRNLKENGAEGRDLVERWFHAVWYGIS